jgi:hypothetical protein
LGSAAGILFNLIGASNGLFSDFAPSDLTIVLPIIKASAIRGRLKNIP